MWLLSCVICVEIIFVTINSEFKSKFLSWISKSKIAEISLPWWSIFLFSDVQTVKLRNIILATSWPEITIPAACIPKLNCLRLNLSNKELSSSCKWLLPKGAKLYLHHTLLTGINLKRTFIICKQNVYFII